MQGGMACIVNRPNLRGILVIDEPPQMPINRGVRVREKITNSRVIELSDQFVNLFSLFLGLWFIV